MASLFSSGSTPSFNPEAQKGVLKQNRERQLGIVGERTNALTPISQALRSNLSGLGEGFVGNIRQAGDNAVNRVVNPALREAFRTQTAKENFQAVPELQNLIRENLAGTGRTGNAAAVSQLANPALDAARNVSSAQLDFDIQQDQARQNAEAQRFAAERGALEAQFGSDVDLENKLFGTGREDVTNQFGDIADIEQGNAQNLIDLENLRQNSEIARGAAETANRTALRNALLQGGITAGTSALSSLFSRPGTPGVSSIGGGRTTNSRIINPSQLPGR